VPGSAQSTWAGLEQALGLGNIYGTTARHGYAFWGWFKDEMLDSSEKVRDGLRRPALVVPDPEEDTCLLFDVLSQIENGSEEEWQALFENGNLDLYGIWVRWGDVDDSGSVSMVDLSLLQRHVNLGHMVSVEFSEAAADVVVDGVVNSADLALLQRHTNVGHIVPVVLGAEPQ